MKENTKPVLITGSEGLIGSLLCNMLSLPSVNIPFIRFDNKIHEKFDIKEQSNYLKKAIMECSGVVHLAAVSRVVDAEFNKEKCWQVNVDGTRNIIDIIDSIDEKERPWIIYGSSREVYGNLRKLPAREDLSPLIPVNYYGYTKLLAESLVKNSSQNGIILRFSNVYGNLHMDHKTRVIPAFIRRALSHDTLRVDGKDTLFDFTYVNDVAFGILASIKLCVERKNSHEGVETIHLVSGEGISLENLAIKIIEMTNSKSKINVVNPRDYDVSHFIGDSSKSQKILGWHPYTSLEHGLSNTIKTYTQFDN